MPPELLPKDSPLDIVPTLALLHAYTPEQIHAAAALAWDEQMQSDAYLLVDHHWQDEPDCEDRWNELLDRGEATLKELDLNDPRQRQLLQGWWLRSLGRNARCAHLAFDAKHLEELVAKYTSLEMCNDLADGPLDIEAVEVAQ